jgi:hypothetical protein
MVGLVIARARHTAKIRAKKGYFMRYPVLNGCDKLKTVCPQTERLSVPVIYFGYRDSSSGNPPRTRQASNSPGEVPLKPWGDIEIYNWDGQTLYCFEAFHFLTTQAIV